MPRAKKADTVSAKAKLKLSDLKLIEPLNENQNKFFGFFKDPKKEIIMAHGVAGTGNTGSESITITTTSWGDGTWGADTWGELDELYNISYIH